MNARLKKVLIVGAILFGAVLLLCAIGGTWIYQGLMKSANDLASQEQLAIKNGILAGDKPERSLPPTENAAVILKHAFDEWQLRRPEISDERWESVLNGTAGEDTDQIVRFFKPVTDLVTEAGTTPKAQWSIDYSAGAFSSYPVWPAVVDGVNVNMLQLAKSPFTLSDIESPIQVANHILASDDPGSLRAAGEVRRAVLTQVGKSLEESWNKNSVSSELCRDLIRTLESAKPIDPLSVWRTTAYLQYDTWENYDKLTDDQKKLLKDIPRDHPSMIDAGSSEILKFWNSALAEAQGKSQLEQLLLLANKVNVLRTNPEQTQMPLQRLWDLASAKTGAGSVDWLLSEELLQLTIQTLEVLSVSHDGFPEKFDCKRTSVIGMKEFTYQRIANGFKIFAEPSNLIPANSTLTDVKMVYEFNPTKK
ncbi:MAG: hypothetical protein KF824_09065 [Fimbriimonadaceae bacterium]|nr:MAG: hypothetical protein KF824_09065 [Fimbriimonadaceae bacterium]